MSTDTTPLADDSHGYNRVAMHSDAVRTLEESAKESALMSPEAARQHVASHFEPILQRYDLLSTESQALAALHRQALGKAPDTNTLAQWRDEAKAALLAEYGPDGVGKALKDAQAFIKQDAQLSKFASKGFGNHKSLVLMAARLGTKARKEGRLK